MYEQVYTPKIDTRAYPGKCLQYIDDAGNSPSGQRSWTAKDAFIKEQNAGRIKGGDVPENIWFVIWFSFSTGSYTYPDGSTIYYKDAWHIAFARRTGNNYEIHDSEVHSGARQPYRSLAEVEAWFKVYGAKYAGWSTNCDGREYARLKKGEEMVSSKGVDYLFRTLLGRDADKKQKESLMSEYTFDGLEAWIMKLPEYKDKVKLASQGQWDILNTVVYPYSQYKKFINGGFEEVKEKLYKRNG